MTQRIKIKGKNKREKIENILNMQKYLPEVVKVAFINFWDRELPKVIKNFSNIIGREIRTVSRFETPDILFCSVFGPRKNAIDKNAKIKIFCLFEPYNFYNYKVDVRTLHKDFDIVLSSHPNDYEKKMYRFPIWLFEQTFVGFDNFFQDNIVTRIRKSRQELPNISEAVLIASHGGAGDARRIMYETISSYIQIKSCGSFLNNTDILKSPRHSDWHIGKKNFLKKYRFWFNICPENVIEEGYITEKLYDALEGGSIPIYNAYADEDILKKEAYINFYYDDIEEKIKNKEKYYIKDPFTENAEKIIYDMYKNLGDRIKLLLNI